MKLIFYFFLICFLSETILSIRITKKHTKSKRNRRLDESAEELQEDDPHVVDSRAILHEKEKDNPLSELWDANNMRVTKQNVSMNMHVPLNRLKLKLSDQYRVKIVVYNDHDFDQLYDYFNPKKEEEAEGEEALQDQEHETKLKSKI